MDDVSVAAAAVPYLCLCPPCRPASGTGVPFRYQARAGPPGRRALTQPAVPRAPRMHWYCLACLRPHYTVSFRIDRESG